MERLTEWRGEHAAIVNHHKNYIDRLAAYEDTGLTPAQIKYILPKQSAEEAVERMKTEKQRYVEWFAWKQAEQDCRLVVLPCKVGDTVYHPLLGEGKVETIYIRSMVLILVVFDDESHLFPIAEFGESVFTSRAEAEAALEGVSEDA